MKGSRPAGATDGIPRSHLERKFALESLALPALSQIAGPQHLNGSPYLLLGQFHL
jgi:hypothetical protein